MPKTAYDYDALYRAIGKTVVAFQALEYTLSDGLCSMMKLRDEDHQNFIGVSMSFRQKVDLFAALQRRIIDEEFFPFFRTACTFFNVSEDFRNTVVRTPYSMAIGESERIGRWAGEKASIRGGKVTAISHQELMQRLRQ